MELLHRAFLDILKAALKNEKIQQMELSPEEWTQLLNMAEEHTVLPLVYDTVYTVPALQSGQVPAFVLQRPRIFRQVMTQTMKTSEFLALNRHLQQQGIRPLVVKGLICRELYPNPDLRPSGDEDVLIDPAQFEECHRALQDFGMQPAVPEEEYRDSYEVPYQKKGGALYIELHKHLFPPESEAYGYWGEMFRHVHRDACVHQIHGTEVYSLSPTDHLFYLICHAFKHFLHSGFGIRQVCDIVLYANRYGSEVDWLQVWDNCRSIRAERFAGALFTIGRKYLVFDPVQAGYPAYWEALNVDERPMLEDLLSGGIYGASTMSRKHSSNITLDAVTAHHQGKKTRASVWGSVFPEPKKLENRYGYLKKHPYLVPVAWADRLIQYRKEVRRSKNNDAAEAIKIGSQRIELFRSYRIID